MTAGVLRLIDYSKRALCRLRQLFALTKPRVVSLIVFTAVIGMLPRHAGVPELQPLVFGAVGIALVAGAAAATNGLLKMKIDVRMALHVPGRCRRAGSTRPKPPRSRSSSARAGLSVLYTLVNPLTMWLAVATFAGYASCTRSF